MARRQQHNFHYGRLCLLGLIIFVMAMLLFTATMAVVQVIYYSALQYLNLPPITCSVACLRAEKIWEYLDELFFRHLTTEADKSGNRRKKKGVIGICFLCILSSFGVQNHWLKYEIEFFGKAASALTDWLYAAFTSTYSTVEVMPDDDITFAMESPSADADDEIARKSLTTEQRAHLLYLSLDWQALNSALQTHDFDTVDAQINHGDFSALSASIHSAFSARMDLSSGLTDHSKDLFDIYEERLASLSLSSVSYLQLYELWQETHELYEDDRCVRSARIYANACYWMQDYLSNLEQADSETLLYYLAEEISAYEKIYQYSNDFDVRKEIRGAYSRIASYQKISKMYRAYAKMISNAI